MFSESFTETSAVLKSQAELDLGLDPLEKMRAFVTEIKRCVTAETWETLDSIVEGINGPLATSAQQALADAIHAQFPLECDSAEAVISALDRDGSNFAFDLKMILWASAWSERVSGNGIAWVIRERVAERLDARQRRTDCQLVRQELSIAFTGCPELRKLLAGSDVHLKKTNVIDQIRQFLNAAVEVSLTPDLEQVICGAQAFVAEEFYREWRSQHALRYKTACNYSLVKEILELVDDINNTNNGPTQLVKEEGCWDGMFNAWFIHTQRLHQ